MGQNISPEDSRITWKGTVSKEITQDGVMPWRIPFPEKDLFAWQLVERAAMPAGIRIEFDSDTASLELFFDSASERSPIDIFCDGEFKATLDTTDLNFVRVENLGTQNKTIQIWLPQYGEFRLNKLIIEDDAFLAEAEDPKQTKWITYGSSITQCRDANSPSRTWPAIVARKNNLDLTCLGYAGQCFRSHGRSDNQRSTCRYHIYVPWHKHIHRLFIRRTYLPARHIGICTNIEGEAP